MNSFRAPTEDYKLFTIDETGAVRYNPEARDINGNPFRGEAVFSLLDPELFCFPVILPE